MKLPAAALPALPVPTKIGLANMDSPGSQDGGFDDLLASTSDHAFQLDAMTEVEIGETIDAILTDEQVSAEYMLVQTDAAHTFTAVQFSLPSVNASQNPVQVGPMSPNPDVKSDTVTTQVGAPIQPIAANVGEPSEVSSLALKSELSVGQITAQFAASVPAPKTVVAKSINLDQSAIMNGHNEDEMKLSTQQVPGKETVKPTPPLPGIDRLANATVNISGPDPRQVTVSNPNPIVPEQQGSGVKIENVSLLKPTSPQGAAVSQQVPVFATVVPHEVAQLVARVSATQLSQPVASLVDDAPTISSSKQATSIELQLVPRTLGVVDVKISSNVPGQLNIEIKTQTAEAETLMRSEMNSIKEALKAFGMSIDELRVNVQQQNASDTAQGRLSNVDGFEFLRDGSGEHLSHSSKGDNAREGSFSEDEQAGSQNRTDDQHANDRVRTGLYL